MDILFRTRQPILQHQEIIAHILCSAGDKTQQFGKQAQHFHLLRTGGFVAAGTGSFVITLATQFLQKGDWPLCCAVHLEATDTREFHDVGSGHDADHCIALIASGGQVRQHRDKMILHEQHGGNDDVALSDIGTTAR